MCTKSMNDCYQSSRCNLCFFYIVLIMIFSVGTFYLPSEWKSMKYKPTQKSMVQRVPMGKEMVMDKKTSSILPHALKGKAVFTRGDDPTPINGEHMLVEGYICRLKNGLLHGSEAFPAVEGPGHIEYWEEGVLKEISTNGFKRIEKYEKAGDGSVQLVSVEEK